MAQTNIPRAQTVPDYWKGNEEEHRRKLGQAVNQLMKGVSNNHFSVTLDAGDTETTVLHPPIRPGSAIQITPGSASAATSFASGAIWVEAQTGKAIIHHDSSTATDRLFHLTFSG
jgi:hypothetical protein